MLNRKVKIVLSEELVKMKLKPLVGRIGEVIAEAKGKGYWVKLHTPYRDEMEWFIPSKSLQIQP